MSSYIMDENNSLSNFAGIEFRCIDNCYTRKGNAADSCGRFLQAAATLHSGGYLGWEIAVDESGAPSNFVFSSKGVDVTVEDYEWIFESSAAVISKKPVAEDSFWDGRQVYVLSCKAMTTEPDKGGRAYSYEDRDEYEDDTFKNFINLFGLMKAAGNTFLRILVQGDGNGNVKGGIILMSLPSGITLRMKTVLSMAFPFTVIGKAEVYKTEPSGQMIPANCIMDGMIGLQRVLMHFGVKMKSGLEECCEAESYGDENLLGEEDLEKKNTDEDKPDISTATPLEDLELSVRTYNCLRRAGVDTVEKLRAMSDEALKKVRNLGRKNIDEIKERLAAMESLAKEAPLAATNYKAMLDELVGLDEVKQQIKKITAYARMKQDMEASGRPCAPVVLNMEFVGNPGTAKTTVARILAGIFHEIGLLSSGEMIEVGRADIIAKYEGQTADKVKNIFKAAVGKLLFIDEAYSLVEQWEGAYGDEAIDTIVQEMENHRDETIVVFAGYPKEMKEFFSRNPGLRSRVPFTIAFRDYSEEEMEQISEMEAGKRGFTIQEQAKKKVVELCKSAKAVMNAGNGRFCRNLVENAILNYASRVYGEEAAEVVGDFVLTESDFSVSVIAEEKAAVSIGFRAV